MPKIMNLLDHTIILVEKSVNSKRVTRTRVKIEQLEAKHNKNLSSEELLPNLCQYQQPNMIIIIIKLMIIDSKISIPGCGSCCPNQSSHRTQIQRQTSVTLKIPPTKDTL